MSQNFKDYIERVVAFTVLWWSKCLLFSSSSKHWHAGASQGGPGGVPEEGHSPDAESSCCWTPFCWSSCSAGGKFGVFLIWLFQQVSHQVERKEVDPELQQDLGKLIHHACRFHLDHQDWLKSTSAQAWKCCWTPSCRSPCWTSFWWPNCWTGEKSVELVETWMFLLWLF